MRRSLNTHSKNHEFGIHKLRFTHHLHSLPRRPTGTTASRPAPTWLPQCSPPNSTPCSRITAITSDHGIRNAASHPSFNELACKERVLLRSNFPSRMDMDYSALDAVRRYLRATTGYRQDRIEADLYGSITSRPWAA